MVAVLASQGTPPSRNGKIAASHPSAGFQLRATVEPGGKAVGRELQTDSEGSLCRSVSLAPYGTPYECERDRATKRAFGISLQPRDASKSGRRGEG